MAAETQADCSARHSAGHREQHDPRSDIRVQVQAGAGLRTLPHHRQHHRERQGSGDQELRGHQDEQASRRLGWGHHFQEGGGEEHPDSGGQRPGQRLQHLRPDPPEHQGAQQGPQTVPRWHLHPGCQNGA